MPVWLTSIFGFLSSLFKYISDRQLIQSGKAEANLDVLERSNEQTQTAQEVKREVNSLDDNAVDAGLSEFTRTDK